MRFRKLRIAFSTFCVIACVLLIALWVRSCWWTEVGSLPFTAKWSVSFGSYPGVVGIGVGRQLNDCPWTLLGIDAADWWLLQERVGSRPYSSRMIGYFGYGGGVVVLPYWFAVFVSATFAGTPWLTRLDWRFSLRTLLLAITAVAVVLGLVAWALG